MTTANRFKARLKDGRRQIGLWQALANAYTAEICAGAGFDWLLFEGEHAPNTPQTLLAQLQAVAPYPVDALARVPTGDPVAIKHYLDMGFQTLIIPFVETAEQARELVRATRYPPEGIRGIAPGLARAARWNREADYLDRAGEQTCLLVQIETAKGLENAEAIAGVEGVDAVFMGPADLSASLGYRGRATHPDMLKVQEELVRRVNAAGKPVASPDDIQRVTGWGCSVIAVGTDIGLIARGAEALARASGCGSVGPDGHY